MIKKYVRVKSTLLSNVFKQYESGEKLYRYKDGQYVICDTAQKVFDTIYLCEILYTLEEVHWYDNIPEGGLLCKVRDSEDDDYEIAVVVTYLPDNVMSFVAMDGTYWICAEPLDQDEIRSFLARRATLDN